MTIEIIEYRVMPELRFYSPAPRYIPERLERRFWCKTSDGMSGYLWLEVHPEATFVRKEKQCPRSK